MRGRGDQERDQCGGDCYQFEWIVHDGGPRLVLKSRLARAELSRGNLAAKSAKRLFLPALFQFNAFERDGPLHLNR